MNLALQSKSVSVGIVLVTLALSALFLAQGANAYVTGALPSADHAMQRAATHAAPRGSEPPDGCAILARNAFDAQSGALCPAKTVAASEPPTPPPAPGPGETPPACDGETRKLIAAVHSERDRSRSFVELTGVGSASQLVQEGDRIDDDEVFAIYPTAVHLKQSCGYYCSLSMFGELAQSGALPAFAPASGGASFKVQRALVESVLQDPGAGLGSIRVVPHSKDGRMVGAKLYGIRKDSPLHTLGLQNGDVLLAINGLEIATPDAALDAYSRLRSESNLSVSLERRGEPMTVDYAIE